jgi:hypothetical protein
MVPRNLHRSLHPDKLLLDSSNGLSFEAQQMKKTDRKNHQMKIKFSRHDVFGYIFNLCRMGYIHMYVLSIFTAAHNAEEIGWSHCRLFNGAPSTTSIELRVLLYTTNYKGFGMKWVRLTRVCPKVPGLNR